MIEFAKKYCKCIARKETVFFLMVIFTNLSISGVGVSQFIYGLLAVFCAIKYKKSFSDSRRFLYVLYFFSFTLINYALYNNVDAFGSSLRFVYNFAICVVFLCCFDNQLFRSRICQGYLYAASFFSIVIIIQFITYYGLGFNLKLDFGDYQGSMNDASNYDPLEGLLYRTGGLFKEPSWYATFVTPCVFILTVLKRYKLLAICVMGTICSTSGLGFAVLAVYGLWLMKRLSAIQIVSILSLVVIIMIPLFFVMEHALAVLDNSESGRLAIYYYFIDNMIITLFGIDPNLLYSYDMFDDYFMNTLSVIYFFWGLVGLFVFLKFSYFSKMKFLSLSIIVIIAIEGCYGRIDFWMMLLACSLFNNFLRYDSKLLNQVL